MSNSPKSRSKKNIDLYQAVTDKIVAALEQGQVPWHQPWRTNPANTPTNFVSKKPYRGINIQLLGLAGFSSPYWMTFNQAKAKGGTVRKGEKSTMIVFSKPMVGKKREEDENGVTTEKTFQFYYLKYFNVFNAEQIDGIDFPEPQAGEEFDPIAEGDAVIDHWREEECPIHYGGSEACYLPQLDLIKLPAREDFESPESYYHTAFHEMGHATGAEQRLKRPGITKFDKFGSQQYGKEELVAEITSCFVAAELGIERLTPTAAYLQNWLGAIKGDKKLVVSASAQAAKAADYILGRETTYENPEEK